jgi:hypothetical protein
MRSTTRYEQNANYWRCFIIQPQGSRISDGRGQQMVFIEKLLIWSNTEKKRGVPL